MSMPIALGLLILFLVLLSVVALMAKHRRWLAAMVAGLAVLLIGGTVAFSWLSFVNRPALLPILAVVVPDREYTKGEADIPLPPRTIQMGGGCTSTGRWYYSRLSIETVVEFYRAAGASVEVADERKPVSINYEGVTFEAIALSANESRLGIGCGVSG